MNFWNDPSQNATKSVLLIAILALVGVGIYQFAGNNTSLTGNVYRGTKNNPTTQTQPENVFLSITYAKDGSCVLTTCADGLTTDGTIACIDQQGTTTMASGQKTCDIDTDILDASSAIK